jgi:hypothetical protein
MMELKDQAKKYLAATDATVWLTYEEYARDRIESNQKAITPNEWNCILSIAGGRKMQDTEVVAQIARNMRTAAGKEAGGDE